MKISEIIPHPLALDNPKQVWTAHEKLARSQLVLVEVRTEQGLVGFGEIASGSLKTVCSLLRMFSDAVQGMDPLGHAEVWNKLMSLTSPRPGGVGGWDGIARAAATRSAAGDHGGDRRDRHRAVGHQRQGRQPSGVSPSRRHAHGSVHLRNRRILRRRRGIGAIRAGSSPVSPRRAIAP